MDVIMKLLQRWGRKPLGTLVSAPSTWLEFDFGEAELHKLLPHRNPFLFCPRLSRFASVGLEGSPLGLLSGKSYLAPENPVFTGHFPDYPVYPGVLQVEMLGQLSLCLDYFQEQYKLCEAGLGPKKIARPKQARKLNIRASKILGAHYLRPVLPGQTVELFACELGERDEFFARMIGQLVIENQVAMVCAQEVCFVD